jgi:SAM-dependent methyltransferase
MNNREFELLDRIEEDHWWFVGKRRILGVLLDRIPSGGRLLDLGCGTGGILRHWIDRYRCVGVDRSKVALDVCRRKGFSTVARCELGHLPFRPEAFDTVLILDVLEHLDDEVRFLAAASQVCAPGGRIIISVPAFQWLWSKHDETFAHQRRYSAKHLEQVIRSAGLDLDRVTYTNSLIFPIAAAWRILSRRLRLGCFAPKHDFWPIPNWLNSLIAQAYRIEAFLLGLMNLPVGVSVVCVARRVGASS